MALTALYRRLLTLLLVCGLALPQASALAQGLPDFTVLVEQNAPAIVSVSTKRKSVLDSLGGGSEEDTLEGLLRYFYEERQGGGSSPFPQPDRLAVGSGFIISADGYVVTNHHVLSDAEEILVTLNDQREFPATVVGSDKDSDLALLKIDAKGLPLVRLGKVDDLKVGEWVLAIGSPFGLSYSVAAGIVSYIGRNLPEMEGVGGRYVSYIQTDVAINPGHSGGPLFNLHGEVVGINSQIFTNSGGSIGLSFAIPVGVAHNVLDQLRATGSVKRGWLGVAVDQVTAARATQLRLDTPHGAVVSRVFAPSPAHEAGFQENDVIISFNGHAIRGHDDLPYQVGLTAPGTRVDVGIIRDGDARTLVMTLGDLEAGALALAPPTGDSPLGLAVEALDEDLAETLGLQGVVVTQVTGALARDAGFQEGDVILSVDGEDSPSPEDFQAALRSVPLDRVFPVLVFRDGRQTFLTVRPAN